MGSCSDYCCHEARGGKGRQAGHFESNHSLSRTYIIGLFNREQNKRTVKAVVNVLLWNGRGGGIGGLEGEDERGRCLAVANMGNTVGDGRTDMWAAEA